MSQLPITISKKPKVSFNVERPSCEVASGTRSRRDSQSSVSSGGSGSTVSARLTPAQRFVFATMGLIRN